MKQEPNKELPSYLPRPGDLPRNELMDLATEAILHYGGPESCEVRFNFTCIYCGSRCTLDEPNKLYTEGLCAICHQTTTIDVGGFSLYLKI